MDDIPQQKLFRPGVQKINLCVALQHRGMHDETNNSQLYNWFTQRAFIADIYI